jgi:LacI family transcriptional regulator
MIKPLGEQMKVTTIHDVASEAGVSITTVSRVLNKREEVNFKTRARVLQVIERLRYMRNTNAANLKQRHTDFVAVILRGRRNIFLTDLAERMMDCGRQTGLQFLLEFIDERADEFLTAKRLYMERKLSGIIFLGSNLKDREEALRHLDLPCVFATVDASHLPLPKLASISVDNFQAGQHAAEQLLLMGHRQIALVGYFADIADSTGLRMNGAVESITRRGIPYDPDLFVDSDFTLETAYRAAHKLLERKKSFTALIAMSDMVAIGASKALFDIGIMVPGDVSVIGFDGIREGQYCTPSLATMVQPADELAQGTVVLLSEMLGGAPSRHVLLSSAYRPGGSVRSLMPNGLQLIHQAPDVPGILPDSPV